MRRIIIIFACLSMSSGVTADGPQEILDQYFLVLTSQNYENLGSIMDAKSMAQMKELMVNAIRQQTRIGRYDLQKNVFGKKVTLKTVRDTPAEFYLHRLAEQIFYAANSQNFIVEGQKVLGRVDESPDMVHYLARVNMSQGDKSTSAVRVFTIVREGDSWKMNFPDTIRQMLQVIEANANRRSR